MFALGLTAAAARMNFMSQTWVGSRSYEGNMCQQLLTWKSPDRNWLFLRPISLLLLTPWWLLFCRRLPFIFSLIDIFSYVKRLGYGFVPGHRFPRESGFPMCLDHRSGIVDFSEDRPEEVYLHSMNKSITPATTAGKVPVLELTWRMLAHSELNEGNTWQGEGRGRSVPIIHCCITLPEN